MTVRHEEKAAASLDLGEKALKKWLPFGNNKFEEAEEQFVKAGNSYKMASQWQESGDAFMRAAYCQQQLKNQFETASHYVSAANSFKKINSEATINCLRMAKDIHIDLGKFSTAAKYNKEMAEILEHDGNLDAAMEEYAASARLLSGEESISQANACQLKVGQMAATKEKYELAIEMFEAVASAALDNKLLRYSVKDYLLNAGLCRLCVGDSVATQAAIHKYETLDLTFPQTRECKFLKDIFAAVEAGDVEQFTNVVYDFDSLTKIDPWRTTLLLRIKTAMTGTTGPNGGGGPNDD
jgi:alpha-soluble NSF attachment protein